MPTVRNRLNKLQGFSLPSETYIDLTVGASGTEYTAPADGWYYMKGNANASGASIEMHNKSNSMMALNRHYNTSNWPVATFIPTKKNEIIKIYYGTNSTTCFRFIYAVGSQPA